MCSWTWCRKSTRRYHGLVSRLIGGISPSSFEDSDVGPVAMAAQPIDGRLPGEIAKGAHDRRRSSSESTIKAYR